ncbi:MAG: glycosyltransferase, partial [Moorea sp. SIO3G5]|nr:glycosyltransferase [Moorena sp. SIO3G5]
MKILISAFNCNPEKGSEDELGWSWVLQLSQMGHEVWVITEANNQPSIEQFISKKSLKNINAYYHNLPVFSFNRWIFKGNKFGIIAMRITVEILLFHWQWGAYQTAKLLTQQVAFDCVHHVTNSCVRRYSFMGFLGLPFILGPLAGGLRTPWRFRKSYPLMGKILDFGRDLANSWIQFNPLMHLTFTKASKIYLDSEQTRSLIPKFYRHKSEVIFNVPPCRMTTIPEGIQRKSTETETFRVLFVGRLLFWKGLHLGLKAFAQLLDKIPNARLTALGRGPEEKWLQGLTEQLGIQNAVDWISWIDQKELISAYLH